MIECVGGASGDMLLGALVDAGVDAQALERDLHRLPLPDWHLLISRVKRQGIAALHVEVVCPQVDVPRHLAEILEIIERGGLPETVCRHSRAVFERLADAEGSVHGIPRDEVHFHEVGAIDAIVDIVGVALGLYMLEVESVTVGTLPVGTGPIHCAHGVLPNPAPATLELLRGVPLRFTDVPGELVTPTAAALLTALGTFEALDCVMAVERIGYGAGTRDCANVPNVTRLLVARRTQLAVTGETVVQIETNLDDMNPQVFEYLMQRLFERGALDVFLTPITMKKSRPATLLSLLCRPGEERALVELVLAETTTLGVRAQTMQRLILPREVRDIETSFGTVRVKVTLRNGREVSLQPEYEDCRRIAEERGLPLLSVMERVRAEATKMLEK